jgi:hypothetical protein
MISVAEAEQYLHWAEAMLAGDQKAAAIAKRDGAKHRLELMQKLYEAGALAVSDMVPVQRELAEAEVQVASLAAAAQASPPVASTAPTFGPVMERVIPFGAPCIMHPFQFRSGRLFLDGHGPATTKEQSDEDWKIIDEAGGIDVEALGGANSLQFVGRGCLFAREEAKDWDTQTAEGVLKKLSYESWIKGVLELKKADLPDTYFFKTSRGEAGILQLQEIVESELGFHNEGQKGYGIRIRYKMVLGSEMKTTSAEKPASIAPTRESEALIKLRTELEVLLTTHKPGHPEVKELQEHITQQEETERAMAKGESEALAKLRGELAALLQKYREGHPAVQGVRAKIEAQMALEKAMGIPGLSAPSDPLREADRRVLQQQYEKTLTELLEAQKDAALGSSQDGGSIEEQTKRADLLKAKIQLLEEHRAELRKQLQEPAR